MAALQARLRAVAKVIRFRGRLLLLPLSQQRNGAGKLMLWRSGDAYFKKDDKTAGLFQKSRQPLLRPGPLLQKNRQTAIAPGADAAPGRFRSSYTTVVKKLTKTQAFGHYIDHVDFAMHTYPPIAAREALGKVPTVPGSIARKNER